MDASVNDMQKNKIEVPREVHITKGIKMQKRLISVKNSY